jgi:phenylalanyl-tRNA synthetase beta chain
MLVSWEWLSQYVDLDMTPDELASRLSLSGLNHESTTMVGSDPVIDLEITSNRGDCLGHIGVAREVAVLYGKQLKLPKIDLAESSAKASDRIRLTNDYADGCPRYTARVIRGVKIGPSPAWLVKRLTAVGIKSVNNVVDVTNYVMLECGQPLHAFDLAKIKDSHIVVRRAVAKESFVAIDHKTYTLDPSTIVIADAQRAVALGGVMGGENSEVSEQTVDLVIESADFKPLLVRQTARSLRLQSPASYRFERRVDPAGVEWANRRCCQLILEVAGGEVLAGMVDTGVQTQPRAALLLRKSQIERVIGIEIPWKTTLKILGDLGCQISAKSDAEATFIPPSWRHDLTREADLIEEVARIYGYDKIPEDVAVPMTPSAKREKDLLLDRVRGLANSIGLDEVLTPSVVTKTLSDVASPWTKLPPLQTSTPLLEGATFLRRSLIPSLLQVRLFNQSHALADVNMFETAVVYLPSDQPGGLPSEHFMMGILGSMEPRVLRGLIESILDRLTTMSAETQEYESAELSPGTGLAFTVSGKMFAWFGQLNRKIKDSWKLDADLLVGEINLDVVLQHFRSVPQLVAISPYPPIIRDLNLVVDEPLRWARFAEVIRKAAGPLLTKLSYLETYRDAKKDGPGKKRVLVSLALQSPTQTMTGEQADAIIEEVVKASEKHLSAKLLV